jgi:hypothetical protein
VTYDGRSLPQNQKALDIVSVGADTTRDALVVSLRVLDVSAAAPAGYDEVGYTVSWHRADGRRFYAEGYRAGAVATFEYGIDPTPDDGPSGASFGGIRTTGSIDTTNNVVRISVPLGLLGAGAKLPRYGASSWTVSTGTTWAPAKGVDATSLGAYRLGIGCSA